MKSDFRPDMCGPWAYKSFMHGMKHHRHAHGSGTLKYLVLMTLQEQPLPGYGIMRAIEEKSGYAPSPGVIYPTLQLLQDQGFVSMTEEEGKKVYTLTEEGRHYLEANQEHIDRINARLERPSWGFIPGVGKRIGALTGTIFSNYSCLDESKIGRIEAALDKTRQQVSDIIFDTHTE